tara:strand:+ start:140 stop:388 length:249 start_codon:yes stop_codon:yes gene_type:complete
VEVVKAEPLFLMVELLPVMVVVVEVVMDLVHHRVVLEEHMEMLVVVDLRLVTMLVVAAVVLDKLEILVMVLMELVVMVAMVL